MRALALALGAGPSTHRHWHSTPMWYLLSTKLLRLSIVHRRRDLCRCVATAPNAAEARSTCELTELVVTEDETEAKRLETVSLGGVELGGEAEREVGAEQTLLDGRLDVALAARPLVRTLANRVAGTGEEHTCQPWP